MATGEALYGIERLRAKNFRTARNSATLAVFGYIGLNRGAEILAGIDITPDNSPISYVSVALTGLAVGAAVRFHENSRRSESSALKTAAFEVAWLKDTSCEPEEWAVGALADANLSADEVIRLGYGAIVKPKRVHRDTSATTT